MEVCGNPYPVQPLGGELPFSSCSSSLCIFNSLTAFVFFVIVDLPLNNYFAIKST